MAQADYVPSAIHALVTGVTAKTSTTPIRSAYAELIVRLAGHPPPPIPVTADALDLEEPSDHLSKVLNSVSAYLAALINDGAQNIPGGLDVRQINALLCDLVSEVTGMLQHGAAALPGRRA